MILPLYKRADAIQEEENNKHKQMEKWERHIKRTFKKDEKFMMLQTYYNQQNYKVWYSLRSTFSILLQIPFFIAAYNYLSNLSELYGVGFWLINDLSQPDKMIRLGNIGYINLLPILMTIFNLLSLYIYSKGQPVKSKIQGCMLAVVFLILLYNSPSGLVLYWTCNNLYSLVKNVVFKSKKSVKKDIQINIEEDYNEDDDEEDEEDSEDDDEEEDEDGNNLFHNCASLHLSFFIWAKP